MGAVLKRMVAAAAALILTASTVVSAGRIRVACVGNSITFGSLIENREINSYPAQLQSLLGASRYDVANFGRPGATLLRKGHNPYSATPDYQAALQFKPDIVIIHLGINDTDPRDWPLHGDEFVSDYIQLIDGFRRANPKARILVALPTPIGAAHRRFKAGTRQWRLEVADALRRVAQADTQGIELIDFDTPLRNYPNLLTDAIHPNAEGAYRLAQAAYSAITGDYGGLRLPAIYQSGMVMQHGRPLRIEGAADARRDISLTLDSITYRTTADNLGRWQVTTAPLAAGQHTSMIVTDGNRTIRIGDIVAGEVWIASGQSNMDFPLWAARGGVGAALTRSDSLLRFYNMWPVDRTDNRTWSDSVCALVDNLRLYKPASWVAADPDSIGWTSAVAVHFARTLRDSLDIPIGIISNPIGGSGIESWIDISTLQRGLPEILVNWQSNDFIDPWSQQRAATNAGAHRHPYEPSYLFAAGIEPLGQFDTRGVIWYQGESNAANPLLHEQMFPMLLDSWRTYFRDTQLPFYTVQLSSIDRPSWPTFRDSQRRLALTYPGVEMVVSHDLGDSLNVHPTDKRPIGKRLARQALHHTYGFRSLTAQGPTPTAAIADGPIVALQLGYADGLTTSDGHAPRTFELAEIDGVYHPATARITNDNKITLTSMDIKHPRFVRYGWQPFTRANVINGDSLPMSTFKLEVANSADFSPEKGLEYGISAPFFGLLNGSAITAGGCNFPTADPLAADARKVMYEGIYRFDTSSDNWERIGTLPQPTAYGMSATTPRGIVMAGGTGADGTALRTAVLLTADQSTSVEERAIANRPSIIALPDLPVAVDNGAAAAIGNRVFIVGGNVDGLPSRAIFSINLDDGKPSWKRLRDMPGNPRVQPAVAAAGGKLYVFGGFAGRHGKHEPTLELGALVYNPSTNKWAALPPLTGADGESVSVGGGVAATLADGRIAIVGGVNKDVFLDALRNQAPDYLLHPIAWYRFNPSVIVYNPADGTQSIADPDPMAARAGAAAMALPSGKLLITGGELKPRIRTAETIILEGL